MGWRVGVDSAGTFTDICLFEAESGRGEVWKVPSTPLDPSRGIADRLTESLTRQGAKPAEVVYFGQGTTVAANALIEERGVLIGLITTEGSRDLLEIGRRKRPNQAPGAIVPKIDTNSAASELVFRVFGAIVYFELRLIAERTKVESLRRAPMVGIPGVGPAMPKRSPLR